MQTVADALAALLSEERKQCKAGAIKPVTLRYVEDLHKRVMADAISGYRLDTLSREVVDLFTKRMLRKKNQHGRVYSKTTVAKTRWHLRRALRHVGVPCEHLFVTRFKPKQRPRKTWLTIEQAHELLAVLPAHRAPFVGFILATAASRNPVELARRGDIDWQAQTILVRGTKGIARYREVPILDMTEPFALVAHEWLRGHMRFRSWANNGPRDLYVACQRAGVPRVGFHDLRRSVGKWLAISGVEYALIAQFMGHSDVEVTRRHYANIGGSELGAAIRRQL